MIAVGTHFVTIIKTAESVNVVENSQKDINIFFMNDFSMVFEKMYSDTYVII